jgi:NAD(P)-dependent dehydrogenase (short-subunit alcohol dehydrogenase family)
VPKRFDSQAKAFLVGAREAIPLMGDGGRIIAITYAEGSRTGGLQSWVGMGSAKAALESLVRYFAVAVAKRGITVNAISPRWTDDSVLNTLPEQVQTLIRNCTPAVGPQCGTVGLRIPSPNFTYVVEKQDEAYQLEGEHPESGRSRPSGVGRRRSARSCGLKRGK